MSIVVSSLAQHQRWRHRRNVGRFNVKSCLWHCFDVGPMSVCQTGLEWLKI